MLDLSTVPNFCAHEHWGSIFSVGVVGAEGLRADFERGARPLRRTGLLDLVLECYLSGWLAQAGFDVEALARAAGAPSLAALAAQSPRQALCAIEPALRAHQLTGVYQCTRRGLLQLYGIDLAQAEDDALDALDRQIAERYAAPALWQHEAMGRAHFAGLIRPVHPEFFGPAADPDAAAIEAADLHPILRVDPLLTMWPARHERRRRLAALTGVEPGDAPSWRECIGRLFELAAGQGCVGIKQLQAYRRPLEYQPREDGEVCWRGELTAAEQRAFEDWLMHECCRQANDRAWAHQIHVGTHNLGESSPLPLAALAARYPRMKLVQLHVWPFLAEGAWLAKQYPNVYLDSCWQTVLNPSFLRDSLRQWLGYVPGHKLMGSHDATTVEMAAGSALYTRELLGEALAGLGRETGLAAAELMECAADFLGRNAAAVYGVELKP